MATKDGSKGNGSASAEIAPAIQPKPKRKYRRANMHPWETIKREYLYGFINDAGTRVYPNLRQLAERYHVPLNSIGGVAVRGNSTVTGEWAKERDQAQVAIEEEAKKRAVAQFGAELAKTEARHLRGHHAAEAAIAMALYETDADGHFIQPNRFRKELSPQDIKALYSVYCEATDRQRILLGQLTQRIEIIEQQQSEPAVLRLLTMEDLANAGRQLAAAMTARKRVTLMLPDDPNDVIVEQ